MEVKEWSDEYYTYIKKYILPSETSELVMKFYGGDVGYDFDYISEHMEGNELTDYKLITD